MTKSQRKTKPKSYTMVDVPLTDVDREALTRAIEMAKLESKMRREQIESKFASGEESWSDIAGFCSYCCQVKALALKPWQTPPACMRTDEDIANALVPPIEPGDSRRDAALLALRLIENNLSRFEPSPTEALARFESVSARAETPQPPLPTSTS
jgi:hypothetical protein